MLILRTLNIELMTILGNILIMRRNFEKFLMNQDTEMFLLQHVGFVINLQKSQQVSSLKMEFLGVTISSVDMAL